MSNTLYDWLKQIKMYKGSPSVSHSDRPYKYDKSPTVTDLDFVTKRIYEEFDNRGILARISAEGFNNYTSSDNPIVKENDENGILIVTFSSSNTGPSTLDVNSIGAHPILKHDGSGLLVGLELDDIQPNADYFVTWNGSSYVIFLSGIVTGGGGGTTERLVLEGKDELALITTIDGDKATNFTLISNPNNASYVMVSVNGKEVTVGDAEKTKACYFSGDGGTTARSFSSSHPNGKVQTGDELYWNGSIAGYQLDINDKININFLI
jgi:hypothetical protein